MKNWQEEGESGATETREEEPMGMGELLEEEDLEYKHLRRGDVVEGMVMGTDRDGVVVDIGSKSEGIIPPHEMHSLGPEPASRLAEGDKVLVYVLQPETPEGQILVSLDRARGEKGWRTLQQRFEDRESFEAEVSGYNKGGLLVNVEGVHAFVPLSQVVGVRPDRSEEGEPGSGLAHMVGKRLHLKVIEINRRRNRVILSERAALQEWRAQQKERLLAELKEGEIRRGKVSSVRSFGVFVDLGGADGLAHLSELSWERNKAPEEMFRVGDEVDVYVMKVDVENKKIALSLRRARPEIWEEIVDKYHVGQAVVGVVTKLVSFGAFARIEGPVEGLIHVSELVDRRIVHPKEVVDEGEILPLKIVRIERDRHRLGLSLRQARDEGERMGFTFTPEGEVKSVPDEIREQFAPKEEKREAEAEKPAAAEEPETKAEEPAEAEATVEEPEAKAEEPAEAEATVEEPEAEAEEPAEAEAAVEEPETKVEEPAEAEAAAEEPEAEAEEPAEAEAAVEEPEAKAEEPAEAEAAVEEPEAEAEEPAEAEATVEEPEAEAEEPAEAEATVEEPEAEAEEPAEAEAAVEEPEAEAEGPAEAEAEDTAEEQKPD